MNKPISFNPEFRHGDIISPKVDADEKVVVIGIIIDSIDESGYVTNFAYQCRGRNGIVYFEPYEISESLIKT